MIGGLEGLHFSATFALLAESCDVRTQGGGKVPRGVVAEATSSWARPGESTSTM